MSNEERDFTATAPPYSMTVARINSLQDHWVHGNEAYMSTLSPTSELRGATQYFEIFTCANAAVTVLDAQRDWRRRILTIDFEQVGIAAQLPKGANYDPVAAVAVGEHIIYTSLGSTPALPPVPVDRPAWQLLGAVNFWLYAASIAGGPAAAGDLCISNNTGAAVHLILWILQTQDVG